MAITQNTYTGNGSTVLYSFAFPYLDTADVKVSLNGTITTAYTFANATTIQFNTAPGAGVAIRIYRETDDTALQAVLSPGSSIRASDLNDNFDQLIYLGQEANNEADSATATANTALTNSNTAISTANTASTNASNAVSTANTANANASAAVTTANTANTNASAAVSTANTASTNASAAVTTANTAISTANSATTTANNAVSTANSALTAANNAVTTANTASSNATTAVNTANTASSNATTALSTANTALSTANTALSNSATAISTANSAIAAVASAVIYTPVANLTALAALTPANGDYFELTDSTGAEGSALITGVTVGLVGAPGLTFRLRFDSPPGIYTFLGYFANDSETRYLKFSGGTLTGQLRGDDSASAATPGFAFDGDPNTGVGRPGADELALITGGTNRLTIDSAGAVAIPGTLGVTGAITGSLTGAASSNVLKAGDTMTGNLTAPAFIPNGSTVPTNGLYLPSANNVAISTNGTGRLFINSSGNVGIGAANTGAATFEIGGTLQVRGSQTIENSSNTYRLLRIADIGSRDVRFDTWNGTDFNGTIRTGAQTLLFETGTGASLTERMRLDSSGRLGLGTSTPAKLLHIRSTDPTIRFGRSDAATDAFGEITADTNGLVTLKSDPDNQASSSGFAFTVDGTSALTIDSSRRVGLGTSSPGAALDVRGELYAGNGTITNFLSYSVGNSTGIVGTNSNHSLEFRTNNTERMRLTSTGLGIGVTSPNQKLDISGGDVQLRGDNATIRFKNSDASSQYLAIYSDSSVASINAGINNLALYSAGTERCRLDSSGRLLVGTSSSSLATKIHVQGSTSPTSATAYDGTVVVTDGATEHVAMYLHNSSAIGTTNGTVVIKLAPGGNGQYRSQIVAGRDGDFSTSGNAKTNLQFYTAEGGGSSSTERMRISNGGSIYQNFADRRDTGNDFSQWTNSSVHPVIEFRATNGSYANTAINSMVARSANSIYGFFAGFSGDGADVEVKLYGDGNGKCDGSWTGGGADYAEYFEWSDGNPDEEDRRGISVVLDGDKIRPAVDGEDPIGVISGNPSVVGDAAWNKWSGKYLRDDYGTYILDENGDRQLNPDYDPDQEYVSREQRPEWDCVGLMGKLRIRKGQPTGSRWIKMRDISDSVEEWLVR